MIPPPRPPPPPPPPPPFVPRPIPLHPFDGIFHNLAGVLAVCQLCGYCECCFWDRDCQRSASVFVFLSPDTSSDVIDVCRLSDLLLWAFFHFLVVADVPTFKVFCVTNSRDCITLNAKSSPPHPQRRVPLPPPPPPTPRPHSLSLSSSPLILPPPPPPPPRNKTAVTPNQSSN